MGREALDDAGGAQRRPACSGFRKGGAPNVVDLCAPSGRPCMGEGRGRGHKARGRSGRAEGGRFLGAPGAFAALFCYNNSLAFRLQASCKHWAHRNRQKGVVLTHAIDGFMMIVQESWHDPSL